jgi:SAM-dependent methyltransferase
MDNGWNESASAWIADMGSDGDFGRRFVLDPPMIDRVKSRGFRRALDVGCGEGRFCRMLATLGIRAAGIDPTEALIRHARELDPAGDYRIGRAEALDCPDRSFDLVISYLTLIDIPDIRIAIAEMVRVLEPEGTLLIANLTSFNHRRSRTRAMAPARALLPDHGVAEARGLNGETSSMTCPPSWPGQSRPKDGVASARLWSRPSTPCGAKNQDVDARDKRGHDES